MSRLSDRPPVVQTREPIRRYDYVGVCVVCKRRHDNIGFAPTRHHPIKWFCRDDSEFIQLYSHMPKKIFDMFESDSIMEGGAAAGQYLDELGTTDLAELDEHQFRAFFVKFLSKYEDAMKTAMRRLESNG